AFPSRHPSLAVAILPASAHRTRASPAATNRSTDCRGRGCCRLSLTGALFTHLSATLWLSPQSRSPANAASTVHSAWTLLIRSINSIKRHIGPLDPESKL